MSDTDKVIPLSGIVLLCVEVGESVCVLPTFLSHLPEFKSYSEGLGDCQGDCLSLESRRELLLLLQWLKKDESM